MIGLGCTVLAVALIFFYLYDTKIRIAQNTTERVTILEPDGETQEITEENAYYRQLVHPEQDSLTGLGVRFFVEADNTLTDEGIMHARVTDLSTGQVMCETDVAASSFIFRGICGTSV